MTPPSGPGQRQVVATHYKQVGDGPVAYVDETYHLEFDGRSRFYIMAAVVVLGGDRDDLRRELDHRVPDGWWHTTNALRETCGRERTRGLLQTFQAPDETCVIVHQTSVDDDDAEGYLARGAALRRLLRAVHSAEHGTHPAVDLVMIEENRVARVNNFDRSIRAELVNAGTVAPRTLSAASCALPRVGAPSLVARPGVQRLPPESDL